MSDASPGLLSRLFWFVWPLIVTAAAIALIWNYLQGTGLPGLLQMPVTPAGPVGAPLQLGLNDGNASRNGIMLSDAASPRVGLGPFTSSNQPQFDLDVLSDTVRFTARSGEGTVQFHLPRNAELVLNGRNPVSLESLLDRIENQSTVANVMVQVEDLDAQIEKLNRSLAVVAKAANEADNKAIAAQQQADSALARAGQAAGRAEQGVSSAAKAQDMASQGQNMAQRAQATGDQATSLANAAQQSANQAMAAADKGIKNSLALKKYVDHRNLEIQQSLNDHYRSNRPGGKELIYRQLTAPRE